MGSRRILPATAILIVFRVAFAAPPSATFARKPTATKTAAGVRIEFAVSAPTDVAVYVEDAAGKVVCHLAAGVLGSNPPLPLTADSLRQSVVWDGKDDCSKPAGDGPFQVRVALGMKPEFDGFLMYNPDSSGYIESLAVGPRGTLYVFHRDLVANGNMGGHKIKVYSRDGKAIKALTPFPANIAPERVKALGVFQTPDGDLVPRIHNWAQLNFYPDAHGVRGRDMPPFSSPAVDSKGRVYWLVQGPSLCAVDADGGIPYDNFLGPRLLRDIKGFSMAEWLEAIRQRPCLAVSSDDRYIYFAGLRTGIGKSSQPLPCVFRVDVEKRGPGEVFLGKLGQAGREKDLLTAPRGLAAAGGLLYVADYQADRVVVFKESERSYVGEIKVKAPNTLGVDPATGAIYVCSAENVKAPDLVKIENYRSGKELYRLRLPQDRYARDVRHRIAVDASAKPVRIWMPPWPYSRQRLFCIDDAGDKFVDRPDPRRQDLFAGGPRDLSVDRLRNELYVKANGVYYRIDLQTGQIKDKLPLNTPTHAMTYGLQIVSGTDGNLYGDVFGDVGRAGSGLWRFDRAGKLLKWRGQKTANHPIGGIMTFQARHLALKPFAPPDEIYYVPPPNYLDPADKSRFSSLNVFRQDGIASRTAIWQCTQGATPRLDAKGNIYLAELVKPADRYYPEFFDGKLDAPPKRCFAGAPAWYSYIYGSIIKFPASGGIVWFQKALTKSCVGTPPAALLAKPKQPFRTMFLGDPNWKVEVQGALWTRFGYSPYSSNTTVGSGTPHCACEASGFDVDPFGRVFFPNLGQFRVEVVDTNNNFITTFGKYGNEDSGGPNATVKKPGLDIPLAWPTYVAVSDTHAYVNDTVSRRVVQVKVAHTAEETCRVK
jgi:hypothetical protein